MRKLFLAALVFQAGFAQACETPNAEPTINSVFLSCQSSAAPNDAGLKVVAAEFCAELGVAIEDKLGKTVSFSEDAPSAWVVSVRMGADRADATILNTVSGKTEDIRFDIMGATLTTSRVRPLVNSILVFMEP